MFVNILLNICLQSVHIYIKVYSYFGFIVVIVARSYAEAPQVAPVGTAGNALSRLRVQIPPERVRLGRLGGTS